MVVDEVFMIYRDCNLIPSDQEAEAGNGRSIMGSMLVAIQDFTFRKRPPLTEPDGLRGEEVLVEWRTSTWRWCSMARGEVPHIMRQLSPMPRNVFRDPLIGRDMER